MFVDKMMSSIKTAGESKLPHTIGSGNTYFSLRLLVTREPLTGVKMYFSNQAAVGTTIKTFLSRGYWTRATPLHKYCFHTGSVLNGHLNISCKSYIEF